MPSDSAVSARRFTMSELVERTGVPAATVRYYLASGLLPPPVKEASNRFLYDERHAELLRLIRLVRDRRGLSIETIGRLLPELLPDLYDKPSDGVFHPQMWDQLLAAAARLGSSPPVPERLVDVGLGLFAKRGYADVSIDDVCRAAAIAKGSFYRHFPSKEELFFAVVAEVGRRTVSSLAEAGLESATELTERLAAALHPYLVVVLDTASLAGQRRPGYGRVLADLLGTVASSVVELSGRAPSEADELVAQALVGGLEQIASAEAPIGTLTEQIQTAHGSA